MCKEEPKVGRMARLKVKDCAEILGVSKRTVQNYIAEGRLKAHLVVTRKDKEGKITYSRYGVFGRDLINFWNQY